MYEALIADLKNREKEFVAASKMNLDFCRIHGAVEALEAMNAEIAALQAENGSKAKEVEAYEIIMKTMPAQRDEAIYRMKAAEAALARVEAERDEAMADMMMAASGRCCQICGRDCAGYEEITACSAFEWRGAQGEG